MPTMVFGFGATGELFGAEPSLHPSHMVIGLCVRGGAPEKRNAIADEALITTKPDTQQSDPQERVRRPAVGLRGPKQDGIPQKRF